MSTNTDYIVVNIFFLVACVVSGGILVDNHPLSRLSIRWFPVPRIIAPRNPITRKVTDVLALLSIATAMVSLFGRWACPSRRL